MKNVFLYFNRQKFFYNNFILTKNIKKNMQKDKIKTPKGPKMSLDFPTSPKKKQSAVKIENEVKNEDLNHDISDSELESIYTWVDEVPIKRPKKNI